MISSFRRRLTSWLMLLVLGVALIAIVVTGFGTDGMGGLGGATTAAGSVAEVGGESVSETELTSRVNRQFDRARAQQPELDMANFLAGTTFEQILNQLIVGKALMQFGLEQGLVASQRMVDREIVNIPAFRNFAGQFDDATFRQALARERITERELRDEISGVLMQRQLLMPIGLAARVPEGLAMQYASLLLERRRGMIGVVPSQIMGQGIAPTDQEVAAFYRENQNRFIIPERRVLRYAVIGREQVAAQAQATDQEIAAAYQRNAATYGPQETRTLQQVVLPDQNAATAFMTRLRGGASFAAAAQQSGFSATDIAVGQQSQAQFTSLTSQQVANAAFTAAQGAVVGPLRSPLGFHVVRIEAINRTAARPLAAVRGEIAQQISQTKLAEALGNLVNRVETQISDGGSFEEVARANGLAIVETPPITGAGQPVGQQWQAPAELQPLLRAAFELSEEENEPVVETIAPNERFALLNLGRVVPAAAPPLAQVQGQVRAALVERRASERARAVAQSIIAKINTGIPAARAFAEAGMRLPAPQPVDARRTDIAQGGQRVPPPLAMLFSIPQGSARVLQAPNGAGWFVIHHVQRTPGNATSEPGLVQTTRTQFQSLAGDEIAQQFARAVQLRTEVERDEDAIRRARARLTGGGAAQ